MLHVVFTASGTSVQMKQWPHLANKELYDVAILSNFQNVG